MKRMCAKAASPETSCVIQRVISRGSTESSWAASAGPRRVKASGASAGRSVGMSVDLDGEEGAQIVDSAPRRHSPPMADTFQVQLERLENYRFRADFGAPAVPALEVDEGPPLGKG